MRQKIGYLALGALLILSQPLNAAEPLVCFGDNPEWKLGLAETFADFTYKTQTRYTVPQKASALNRDWPKAYTLVARNSTAIVLIDQDACRAKGHDYPMSIDVLTQDGTAAIVLTGCCIAPNE